MKRYIRAEYIRSSTNIQDLDTSEVSQLFYNYIDECYKSSGIASQYPDIELEYNTTGSTYTNNYGVDNARVSFVISGNKNYNVNATSRFLMQFGMDYVIKYNKDNSQPVRGITEGSYYINKEFDEYLKSGVSGTHRTTVADTKDYMKRNPDIKSIDIEDVLPRRKVISLIKKYIPMCYDAFLDYVDSVPDREAKAKEEKERRQIERRNLLNSIDLNEEFEKHRGIRSQYVVGNNIRDRGSSPIIHKYEWEFSTDGDYFALIALSLGNMIEDSYVDDSTLEYEVGEEFLKDIFYHYPTYTKLLKSPFIKDVKHPDEYTTVSYLKNASTGKYLFGKPD